VADRRLTDEQVGKIAKKFETFERQEFGIVPYWDFPESVAIANRIYDVLTSAKWKYIPPPQAAFLMGGIAGVLVYVNPGAADKTKNAANSLVTALNDEKITAVLRQKNDPNPENTIQINVGSKP
jgi:hypothetical protein